jgi:hypothetical protein
VYFLFLVFCKHSVSYSAHRKTFTRRNRGFPGNTIGVILGNACSLMASPGNPSELQHHPKKFIQKAATGKDHPYKEV